MPDLSEIAFDPPRASVGSRAVDLGCFVSALTLMELGIGVLCRERRDGPAGRRLRAWLDTRVVPRTTAGFLHTGAALPAPWHAPAR
ncbi:hypothetical protein [Xylophilus sp.]|uniref:hypothetical protein n=1 Tax=Xylophilus sp. TaxID=2653893 RepID=UPI002D7F5A55|nr:hypothetical protein [Xylophilus sp.]